MKKLTLSLMILLFSGSAFADYFFCEIRASYGFVRARSEAEYRVYSTSTEDSEFRCEGYIKGSTTFVKATALNDGGEEFASENSSTAEVTITGLANQGDFLTTVICKCGMN
jgi:hypothetical protein